MSENYRIIKNSSGTKFCIQEKTYSWKNIIMNLLLTCLQGEGMFKEQHQWETVFCHFSFEAIVREIERMERLEKDQDPSTWSVVDYESIVREIERMERWEKDKDPSTWSVVDYDS